MSNALDDFIPGETIVHYFNTQKAADGSKITLAGSPAVSIYKGSLTAETTTGPTLTVDFDARTGMHCVSIATTDSFYVANQIYHVVLTAGTVDGTSVVGSVIYRFSLGMKSDSIRRSTAQAGASGTITLDAGASAVDDFYNGCGMLITGGLGQGQAALITDYAGASKIASVAPNWRTNPDNTSVFTIIPGYRADLQSIVGIVQTAGDAVATANSIKAKIDMFPVVWYSP